MLKKPANYDEIEINRPFQEGGYILKIVKAMYDPNKNYIKLCLDIHEGEFKGYFAKKEYNGQWSNDATKYLSLDEKATKFLKADITSIENSNNFRFDWKTEKQLEGKLVGGIFRKEQYQAFDGSLKFKVKLDRLRSVETIVSGKFEVPEPKMLAPHEIDNNYIDDMKAVASFMEKPVANDFEISDDDLPF